MEWFHFPPELIHHPEDGLDRILVGDLGVLSGKRTEKLKLTLQDLKVIVRIVEFERHAWRIEDVEVAPVNEADKLCRR